MLWQPKKKRIAHPKPIDCRLGLGSLGIGLGFGGGRANVVMATAVKAASAGDRYASGALDFFSETPGTVRIRFRVEAFPSGTGLQHIAGHSWAGGGWLLCMQDANTDGRSALVLWVGVDGALKQVGIKMLLPEMVGQILTVHIVFDGTKVRWYLDGWEAGKGYVTAGFGLSYTAYNTPSEGLSLCSRSNGTLTTDHSLVEVAISSSQLTATQVATDAAKAVGVAISGEIHRWTAYQALGSTWNASAGAVSLTRTGAPTVSSVPSLLLKSRGVLNGLGDSVLAGARAGGAYAEGWRRPAQKKSYSLGKGFIWTGSVTAGAYPLSLGTYNDYDSQHNGTGGERLQNRVGSLATQLPNIGGPYTNLLLAYGLNDFADLGAGGRTKAQFETDLTTAVSTFFATRPNAPRMYIVSCYDPADAASGFTAAGSSQHIQLQAHLTNFNAFIASLQGTYPRLRGINISGLITNPNDVAQLFDGTHPSPAMYQTIGDFIGSYIGNDLPIAA